MFRKKIWVHGGSFPLGLALFTVAAVDLEANFFWAQRFAISVHTLDQRFLFLISASIQSMKWHNEHTGDYQYYLFSHFLKYLFLSESVMCLYYNFHLFAACGDTRQIEKGAEWTSLLEAQSVDAHSYQLHFNHSCHRSLYLFMLRYTATQCIEFLSLILLQSVKCLVMHYKKRYVLMHRIMVH